MDALESTADPSDVGTCACTTRFPSVLTIIPHALMFGVALGVDAMSALRIVKR